LKLVVHKRVGLVTDERARSQKTVDEVEIFTRTPGGTDAEPFVIPTDVGCEVPSDGEISARADQPGGVAPSVVDSLQAGPRRHGVTVAFPWERQDGASDRLRGVRSRELSRHGGDPTRRWYAVVVGDCHDRGVGGQQAGVA